MSEGKPLDEPQRGAKARRLPAACVLALTLLLGTCYWSISTAQGLTEDPDLRRLRDGASRLRELQGWEGRGSDSGRQQPVETPAPAAGPPAAPPLPAPPPEPETLPRASAPVEASSETSPPPAKPLGAADAWQILLWQQDTLAARVDREIGELMRRLLALEERIAQLSAMLAWLSGASILLLAMVAAMALRLHRPPPDRPAMQEESSPPSSPYLPLPVLPPDDRLAACELLLLSGHYRQCLQQSRTAASDATMAELPLLYFFEAAARRLLGEEDNLSEERLRASVKRTRPCDWPLNEIDSWLLLADMPEHDRTYLESLVKYLRPWDGPAAKENPSGAGGV